MVNADIFRTVARDSECEIEEKRSTFIAAVRRVLQKKRQKRL